MSLVLPSASVVVIDRPRSVLESANYLPRIPQFLILFCFFLLEKGIPQEKSYLFVHQWLNYYLESLRNSEHEIPNTKIRGKNVFVAFFMLSYYVVAGRM